MSEKSRFRRICPDCGALFDKDAVYCSFCGAERTEKGPDEKEASANPNSVRRMYCSYCGVRLGKGKPCHCEASEAAARTKEKEIKKKRSVRIAVTILVLALLGSAGGGYAFWRYRPTEKIERQIVTDTEKESAECEDRKERYC